MNKRDACQEAAEEYRLNRNDLVQQTRSADAAEAVAGLTFVQSRIAVIGIILGFVTMAAAIAAAIFARKAAVETEKGANAAFAAVAETEEANRITRDAQRPWISVEVEITEFRAHGGRMRFSYVVRFRNIGQSIADNLWTISKCALVGADHFPMATDYFNEWRKVDEPNFNALMPGEEIEHWGGITTADDQIPWYGDENDKRFKIMACAAAYYRIPGETGPEKRRITERTFLVGGKNINRMKQLIIMRSRMPGLSAETAVASQSTPTQTT